MHTSSTNISCTFTYDQFGNPLSYYNGKRHTMTWRNGRELNSVTVGGKTYSYEYDVNGLRTRKTNADGTYSDYYWMESMLLAEVQYAANGAFIRTLKFLYDENNTVVGISVKNAGEARFTSYYYAKNLQGDVVAVYRSDYTEAKGYYPTLVASYEYDPWGKVISVKGSSGAILSLEAYPNHIAHVNPIRYRGYYYDNETGLYYLQSRYYDPAISRFINADSYGSTGQGFLGTNMFAYCGNCPVSNFDPTGNRGIWSFKHDWAGVAILKHWLYGQGRSYIAYEGAWGRYMRANTLLNGIIINLVDEYGSDMQPGGMIFVDITTNAVIENGESIIGYQYLHGTNSDVGGFHVSGTIGKGMDGNLLYDLFCTWNDMIDPNFMYESDSKKAKFAKSIPFADPTDYYISITWREHNYATSGCRVIPTSKVLMPY